MNLFRCANSTTSQPRLWQAVFGALVLVSSSGALAAGQVIDATQIVVIETQGPSVADGSESELTAIGGTRAKAIGGTRAKAIGGTRAKAIGGTRAKAIGGTRVKAIGGTRLLAVADTQVRTITGAKLADSAHRLIASPVFESATVSFMGESYDWIVIAPLQYMDQGRASALGYELEFQDESTLQSLFNNQSMVMVASRHSDGQVVSLATSDTFVSGVTEVVTAAQVANVDASTGTLTLSSGVVVDYTQLLSNQSQLALSQGDFVFVQGQLY